MAVKVCTDEEVTFVKAHRGLPKVEAFVGLYNLQVARAEPAGWALMECALKDVRQLMREQT